MTCRSKSKVQTVSYSFAAPFRQAAEYLLAGVGPPGFHVKFLLFSSLLLEDNVQRNVKDDFLQFSSFL